MRPGRVVAATRLRGWALAFFVLVFLTSLTVMPTSAKQIWDARGGAGDAEAFDECPAGQYLVGLKGNVGAWIGQIQIVCSSMTAWGVRSGPLFYGPARGSTPAQPTESLCDDGSVVTLIGFTADRQLSWVELFCESPVTGKSNPAYLLGTGGQRHGGSGGANDGATQQQQCSRVEIGTGLRIRYGRDVNALGLICDKQPVAAPMATLPAPPPKVIIHTGRNPDGTPANIALAPFAGSWKTDTDQNGHYLLALKMDGNQVSGTFTNSAGDQKYNGTLTGTVNGNILHYTYVQPAVNGKGSGFFMLLNFSNGLDDDAITGSGTTDDASQTKFKWVGKRDVKVFDETFAVGTNLGGSDYRNVALNDNFPSTCRDLCQKDAPCRAWTWVKPGVQNATAMCWLKNAIPTPNADANTTSGVKVTGDAGVH